MSSVSPTSVSPAAPPKTIAPNLCLPVSLFNCLAFLIPFCAFLLMTLAYLPVLLAFNALLASLVAIFAPAAAGVPICISACVSLPIALCSAISSKGFIVSKNFSTSSATSVPAPRSMSSAPSDTTPSTVLITPDATPAPTALSPLTSSGVSISILVSSRFTNAELEVSCTSVFCFFF